MIVAGEFCQRELPSPIVLKIIDIASQVLFHDGIEPFRLSIGLRVKRRGESTVNVARRAESFPELGDKHGPAIGDSGLGETVKFETVLDIQLRKVLGGCCIAAGNQVSHLGKSTSDNEYCITAVGPGESGDKVHRDIFPGAIRDWQWSQNTERGMAGGTGSLTRVTLSNISFNVFSKGRPVVSTLQQFNSL